ncbi:pheromone A receptor-domain-containing protein [Mycena latifolia]|nr:pheromone A receptor-domain-containing protein [Mycena latifolia]
MAPRGVEHWDVDWLPAWCDISTHFLNGFNLAIPACSLCINRRLYQIASVSSVTNTRAEKHQAIMIDLAIGLKLRIPEHQGVKEFLSSHNNLNVNRYVRLMCLASTDLFLTIPLNVFVLYANVAIVGISPWVSWADMHSNFSHVVQVPTVFWRADTWTLASLETTRWATVACMFLFYFGFTDAALKNYRSVLSSNGCSFNSNAKAAGLGSMLPVFIRKETVQKRDACSCASFNWDTSFSDMSASFAGISYVGSDAFDKESSFGVLMVHDVGGLLSALPVHATPHAYASPTAGRVQRLQRVIKTFDCLPRAHPRLGSHQRQVHTTTT